jgi:hypothetical protein
MILGGFRLEMPGGLISRKDEHDSGASEEDA